MIESEIGLAECLAQEDPVERPVRVATLPCGLDAYERQRGIQASHNREEAAALVSRP